MQALSTIRALSVGSILVFAHASMVAAQSAIAASVISPPVAPVKTSIDDYTGPSGGPLSLHGEPQGPGGEAWFKAQNDYTRAVLGRFGAGRKCWRASGNWTSRCRRCGQNGCLATFL